MGVTIRVFRSWACRRLVSAAAVARRARAISRSRSAWSRSLGRRDPLRDQRAPAVAGQLGQPDLGFGLGEAGRGRGHRRRELVGLQHRQDVALADGRALDHAHGHDAAGAVAADAHFGAGVGDDAALRRDPARRGHRRRRGIAAGAGAPGGADGLQRGRAEERRRRRGPSKRSIAYA